jgi:hypothetical protein
MTGAGASGSKVSLSIAMVVLSKKRLLKIDLAEKYWKWSGA